MLEKVDLQKTVDKETYRQVSEELGERAWGFCRDDARPKRSR